LRCLKDRLGEAPEDAMAGDVRRLVAEAVSYLSNNALRVDYPRYRREGLPATSSLLESLVGELSAQVKDPGTFWNRLAVAEAILQVRSELLSEDDRLARHFAERLGSPYRCRKKAAKKIATLFMASPKTFSQISIAFTHVTGVPSTIVV
jgi:hypothetical protein